MWKRNAVPDFLGTDGVRVWKCNVGTSGKNGVRAFKRSVVPGHIIGTDGVRVWKRSVMPSSDGVRVWKRSVGLMCL